MGADQLLERFAPDRAEPFEDWCHEVFEPFIDELGGDWSQAGVGLGAQLLRPSAALG